MNEQEIINKTHEITDELEHIAHQKLIEEQKYHEGYIQACEDFGRRMRAEIIQED